MCAAALRRHYSHSLQLTFSIQSRWHVSHNTNASVRNQITANGGHLHSSWTKGIRFSWTQNQLGLTSASQNTASVVKNICVGNKMANDPFHFDMRNESERFLFFPLKWDRPPPFQHTVWANELSRRAVSKKAWPMTTADSLRSDTSSQSDVKCGLF